MKSSIKLSKIFVVFSVILSMVVACQNKQNSADVWSATFNADIDELNQLVESGANFNIEDDSGNTPLHLAVQIGDLEIVLFLLSNGAEKDVTNNSGLSPYDLAESQGFDEMASYLTLTVDDVDIEAIDIWTAAKKGDIVSVSNLLSSGLYLINEEDEYDRATPLHWAVYSGNLDMVKYLVEKGAAIDYMMRGGIIPLHWAAFYGHLDIVKYLLDELPYTKYSTDYKGKYATHWAAFGGQLDVLKYLIEEKYMNVNEKDWSSGNSPIDYAIMSGDLECVKYLYESGASISGWKARDYDFNTPMHIAAEGGFLNIVTFLYDEGLSITKTNAMGETPLHRACRNSTDNTFGSLEVVKYLVENGAQVNKDDKLDRSPLYWAAYSGNLRIVQFLVDNDAYIYNRTVDDVSIVGIARDRGHEDIENYILEKQAED